MPCILVPIIIISNNCHAKIQMAVPASARRAYLTTGLQQVLLGGVGDGFLELQVTGWQHHGDIALPILAEDLQPFAGEPVRTEVLELPTPAA